MATVNVGPSTGTPTTLRVDVQDGSGAALDGASVRVVGYSSDQTKSTASGYATFPVFLNATYNIEVAKTGFFRSQRGRTMF